MKRIGVVLRWFFGVVFGINAVFFVSTFGVVVSVTSLILASILIPPLDAFITKKIKERFPSFVYSRKIKIIIVIIALFIFEFAMPTMVRKSFFPFAYPTIKQSE